jgi:RNA polymerase sigma factor (sigma-70 family)
MATLVLLTPRRQADALLNEALTWMKNGWKGFNTITQLISSSFFIHAGKDLQPLLRKKRREDWIGGQAVHGLRPEDAEPSPEIVYETKELHRLVFKAIESLPREQQEAVKLHYLRGLKLNEIAILTNSPIGTLKARLHHARARLRDSLVSEIVRLPHAPLKENCQ